MTEFCEGGDLEELIKKRNEVNQKLPVNIITKWTRQLTEALKYMHERLIIILILNKFFGMKIP